MTSESQLDDLTSLVHGMKTVASSFRAFLNDLHRKHKALDDGALDDTIPKLAQATPHHFGICVVDTNGKIYEVGESKSLFTLHALANPFVYGLALEDRGHRYVQTHVDATPTTDLSSVFLLDEHSQRRPHPLATAGALVGTGMIQGNNTAERLHRIRDTLRRYTGSEVLSDAEMYASIQAVGHRQRALAQLLFARGLLSSDVDETLQLFFQHQALLVTCRDLAVMGATLASGGLNPVTQERAVDARVVPDLLDAMYTGGMRGHGAKTYHLRLPAASSISGGIIAVVPHQVGIAVLSPLLDECGHSVRGVQICEALVQEFELDVFGSGSEKLRTALNERATPAQAHSRSNRARQTDDE